MSPDRRQHRGAHPEDRQFFGPEKEPTLQQAVAEYDWLRTRDYPVASTLKLVGDRHQLVQRQREAVRRAGCSDAQLARRAQGRRPLNDLRDQRVAIDGFNVLILLEAALSGGPILQCRDGCRRDLSGIHGSYQAVTETEAAIELVGAFLAIHAPRAVVWFLDRPVSNSGRLRRRIEAMAARRGWPWTVEMPFNPDRELTRFDGLVATTDSAILDAGVAWVNLGRALIEARVPTAWLVHLVFNPDISSTG